MSAATHFAQEDGRQDALFDWVWKKDDLHYERERLARYRHAAGKAQSGNNTAGSYRDKPLKEKPSKCRRFMTGNVTGGRASHVSTCHAMRDGAKYPANRCNTLLARRYNSM